MARIAYADHSFHRTTKSNMFLKEVLRRAGHEVHEFWDDAWQGGAHIGWDAIQHFDAVIMFQSHCPPPLGAFRLSHPNVTYIPMLDQFGLWQGPHFNLSGFWEPFQGSKVLSFSNAVHAMATGFGIASHHARFYLPPATEAPPPVEGLRGFFWLRRQEQISWTLVRRLIGDARFDGFHIHLAHDPGSPEPVLPSQEDVARHKITMSTWFEDRNELAALIDRVNVYFAPRMEEGIGMSFLEAMARGKCVVAPDEGTMNEYILHGVNGLLYDHRAPAPLDFSNVKTLGAQTLASIAQGHAQWVASADEVVRFMLTPSEAFYVGKYQHVFPISRQPGADVTVAASEPVAPSVALLSPGTSAYAASLRAMAGRYTILKATRPLWHPLVRFLRRMRQSWRRI